MARQLTLLSASLFAKLTPAEFCDKNWCRENKRELSPNILAIIAQFNKVRSISEATPNAHFVKMSMWASSELLQPFSVKKRGPMLKKLLEIAKVSKTRE